MKRKLNKELNDLVGEKIRICGWINTCRDHGKLIFLDLRDISGLCQIVILPDNKDYKIAEKIKIESVVEIIGKVQKRPDNAINDKIASGKVEVVASEIKVISQSEDLPFEIDNTQNINEETRLKYRYLDLRSSRMRENILFRARANKFIRDYLVKNDFIEIETPFLTKSTPEGARDYVVPSRISPGNFYALPQSPQQYKQLLMVAGFEKYFQIVRCMRDEDQRGDRQPEFTQIDIEASFIDQEYIIGLIEKMLINFVKELSPEKTITQVPFPRITYQESIQKYKTDKPDLRKNKNNKNELAFAWIVDFPMFEKKDNGSFGPAHHPFTGIKNEYIDDFENRNPETVIANQYDLALNGSEIAGGSIRTHDSKVLERVFKFLGHSEEQISNQFGHLLQAFKFGVPPHGGIAIGYDRLLTILRAEKSIREVIAFPKTGDARDPLMDSPSKISHDQLKELHLEVKNPTKKK
ncbi:MAG: aspartyl-tRNA synthetase [Candidatus Berkelbacteria bacterium Licking1014_85]|uniref:Aspartate--tRNA(Asp/Asn) ligase n=1 Tax=Candidatus Berkelbacteria bacterium Licking1014_85 TaxID=2017148 RepID=A0A554LMP4_9BACT|nr:MAG: aspartyl-tRNA synthetase [Candidatus Berkelbacteria bacterium Licking1014_85]